MTAKTPMLKLLYVVSEDWYFCSHRLSLAQVVQKQGYEVHVATTINKDSDKILAQGFILHPLKQIHRAGMSPFQDLRFLLELWHLYHKIQPDIVHHVAIKPVLYGSIAANLTGVKRIINALGGVGYLFIAENWRTRLVKTFLTLCLKRFLKRHNQTLIVQNPEDYALWQTSAKLAPENIALILGSGVNLTQFHPLKKASLSIPVILCTARMLWDKGIGELAQAAQILKHQGISFRLILCGAIDHKNPSAIEEKLLLKWQTEGLLEWHGHVENPISFYHLADIAVLPSYREGLPKSLLEAAACGLPLVATDVPGCKEIVQHQETGLLVPAKNPQALAKALEILISDEYLRHSYGKAARSLVEKKFSDDLIINQTLALYHLPS